MSAGSWSARVIKKHGGRRVGTAEVRHIPDAAAPNGFLLVPDVRAPSNHEERARSLVVLLRYGDLIQASPVRGDVSE